MKKDHPIDENRIYATGHSNGGAAAHGRRSAYGRRSQLRAAMQNAWRLAIPPVSIRFALDRWRRAAAWPCVGRKQSLGPAPARTYRSQPTIDPKRMQEWVPGVEWGAPALGSSFKESLKRRDELLPILEKWSPDHLLRRGTPPLYFENEWGLTQPEGVTDTNYKVHSPAWAVGFQKLAEKAGVVCHVKYPGHPTEKYQDIWDFIVRELKAGGR
jgi:hypothetical protein